MTEVAIAEGMENAIARFHAREPGSRAKAREERRQASRGAGDTPEEPAS
jgi:hypothetical protein